MFTSAALLKDITINRSAATKALTLFTTLLLAGVLTSALTGCDAAARAATQAANKVAEAVREAPPSGNSGESSVSPADLATARAQLETIPVKGRAPKTGYTREEFGPAWTDFDRNGCDTRNDILARDLDGETFKPGTQNCVVATGTLADKYTGTTINFVRGNTTSSTVQIDHVVALSDAWQKGAQQLSAEQRRQLANDPLNLMAADGPTNSAKGDKDAATWLPPNKAFRCEYVARQTAVKANYSLWITQAERDAIAGILAACS
ncbi:HNH endonuclease family protein [Pseudarthrobacter sp. RMG13]|uniref:HNH endonuclease family protein n=1 Tax=Pseudarthrobacter humi TaxID=2952523 RepID=A0ABT1LRR5_9MICC|nr:HNH endonuclease family protein [Pseudarthrobacter humi]MCP9000666.1 HNH endonuclease family protein [Pseudarthrobacter humi]